MSSIQRNALCILLAGWVIALSAGCSSNSEKKIEPDDRKRQFEEINNTGKKERGI